VVVAVVVAAAGAPGAPVAVVEAWAGAPVAVVEAWAGAPVAATPRAVTQTAWVAQAPVATVAVVVPMTAQATADAVAVPTMVQAMHGVALPMTLPVTLINLAALTMLLLVVCNSVVSIQSGGLMGGPGLMSGSLLEVDVSNSGGSGRSSACLAGNSTTAGAIR